ncbi:MAG TPA: glycosyltransferase family 39 protein [Solirubrobacteraceae bacterium]|jgi:mannosyltransferase|nr:glycosyltransferase family 39 protein [Solirubrobacteraceae bacterium]
MSAVAASSSPLAAEDARRLPAWWPLLALTLLAAVLRFATLGEQSFWYDEAFTPVHVLHSGVGATWRAYVHSENTPPLWYALAWIDYRIFGDGAIALRFPSAIAGVLTVPVVWALSLELVGGPSEARSSSAERSSARSASARRAAFLAAAIVAVDPLFVWYSQEARAYALFVLFAALAMLCFARLLNEPTRGRALAFALSGALALLSHYFAVFLLVPMALWLLRDARTRKTALAALVAIGVVGLALIPLISAQRGHGTQWIGRWALSSRLQAIPQYFLTGYSGAPLGHGVELLVALPLLAGAALGAWRLLSRSPGGLRRAAWIALSVAGFGVLAPIVLVGFGADYLAPRNLVGAMIPVSVLIAVLFAAIDQPRLVAGLAALALTALLIVTVDVDASPRLQRGNWRDLAHLLRGDGRARAITTVELGAAPLEYYLSPLRLRNLARDSYVKVSEIDETGYRPLRADAARAPSPGFRLLEDREIDGLFVYRFVSSLARFVSESDLRGHVITLAHPEVLVPAGVQASNAPSGAPTH